MSRFTMIVKHYVSGLKRRKIRAEIVKFVWSPYQYGYGDILFNNMKVVVRPHK